MACKIQKLFNFFHRNIKLPLIYGPRREKTCILGLANNKGADQPEGADQPAYDQHLCYSLIGKYHI